MKNFIEEYVSYAEPQTAASRKYHVFMAYSILSQVIGRRALYHGFGGMKGPNLWFAILGPSSMGFKSTVLRIGSDILFEVYKGVIGDHIPYRLPNGGSYESFVECVDIQREGIILSDEFVNLLQWMEKDYSRELMTLLTSLYDQPPTFTRRVGTRDKAKTYDLGSTYVNIFSLSTIEWFNKRLKEEMIVGGFLPRFILVKDEANPKILPITPKPDYELKNKLVASLQGLRSMELGTMDYEPAAFEIYNEWYTNSLVPRTHKASFRLNPFYHRRASDVHKFAMIHAILRGSLQMNKEDIDSAILIIEQVLEDTAFIVNEKIALDSYQKDRDKVLTLISKISKEDNNNRGARHSTVLSQSHLQSFIFKRVIDSLIEEEVIEKNEFDTSTKKVTFYAISRGE